MSECALIVGIDLGTTNSEIAAWKDGKVQVLGPGSSKILPSCVGLATTGELLIGQAARNQALVAPDRTLISVKRKMGSDEKLALGDQSFTPQEVSALLLRTLAGWAEKELGERPQQAILTVPAYFSDAQRLATREAGTLAGLEVVRILNEPTAASLAYGHGAAGERSVLVYDLGGGTFDVSIVRIEGDVTEVLASHGDNQLGGDDFDVLLAEHLAERFRERHGLDLREGHPAAWSRLRWAAETAKRTLSAEPYASVREDNLAEIDGRACHLDLEIARATYEQMISPLLERTLESVHRALRDSGLRASSLDAILLVGGSTRTPLVSHLLHERTGIVPSREVHPDLCVALGAGVLASRLAGQSVERVLVDVSPYSFGPAHLGLREGEPYPYCYRPIIERNTALPVTRTESYYTASPFQSEVHLQIFQGEDPDALKNVPIGEFRITGLTEVEDENEVLCRMNLDLDGILRVSATEKRTGLSREITIEQALRSRSAAEIEHARERLARLHDHGAHGDDFVDADWEDASDAIDADSTPDESPSPEIEAARERAATLIARSQAALERMHAEDREEAIGLHEAIHEALEAADLGALERSEKALEELLFFVEG